MRTVFESAAADGRDYITPEDVTASFESGHPADLLRVHVLQALGNVRCGNTDKCWGIEDRGLTAFVASEVGR